MDKIDQIQFLLTTTNLSTLEIAEQMQISEDEVLEVLDRN